MAGSYWYSKRVTKSFVLSLMLPLSLPSKRNSASLHQHFVGPEKTQRNSLLVFQESTNVAGLFLTGSGCLHLSWRPHFLIVRESFFDKRDRRAFKEPDGMAVRP